VDLSLLVGYPLKICFQSFSCVARLMSCIAKSCDFSVGFSFDITYITEILHILDTYHQVNSGSWEILHHSFSVTSNCSLFTSKLWYLWNWYHTVSPVLWLALLLRLTRVWKMDHHLPHTHSCSCTWFRILELGLSKNLWLHLSVLLNPLPPKKPWMQFSLYK
jgi:hypothetical protein